MIAESLPYRMQYVFAGDGFDFDNPEANRVTVLDIAHSLSMLARFNGHAREHYSVAQHSVTVCDVVAGHLGRPDLARDALLHDAAEFATGDLVRPFKRLIESRCDVVQQIEAAVARALGCEYPTHPVIKRADRIVLAAEVRRLFPNRPQLGAGGLFINLDRILDPAEAEAAFLDRYEQIEMLPAEAAA